MRFSACTQIEHMLFVFVFMGPLCLFWLACVAFYAIENNHQQQKTIVYRTDYFFLFPLFSIAVQYLNRPNMNLVYFPSISFIHNAQTIWVWNFSNVFRIIVGLIAWFDGLMNNFDHFHHSFSASVNHSLNKSLYEFFFSVRQNFSRDLSLVSFTRTCLHSLFSIKNI